MYYRNSSYVRWLWDNALEAYWMRMTGGWDTYILQKNQWSTRYRIEVVNEPLPEIEDVERRLGDLRGANVDRRFYPRFTRQQCLRHFTDGGEDLADEDQVNPPVVMGDNWAQPDDAPPDDWWRGVIEQAEIGEDGVPIVKKKPADQGKPFLERTLAGAFPGAFRWGAAKGEVGIEIEVEGEDLFREPISYWNAVADPSLRAVGDSLPIEYVLKKPLDRDEVPKALKYLAAGLRKARVAMSHRTSVHVHVNIRELSMMKLINFICLYWILEGLLVEWSGPDRKGNLFCLRAQDAEWQVAALSKACQTFNFGEVFYEQYRYSACNMASLQAHGSLEFRSMKGTTDIERIQEWVNLLTAVKDRAIEFKNPAEIGTLFLSVGAARFLREVLGDAKVSHETFKWLADQDLDLLNTSFEYAKDACYAIDWDQDHKKETGTTNRSRLRQNNEDEDY